MHFIYSQYLPLESQIYEVTLKSLLLIINNSRIYNYYIQYQMQAYWPMQDAPQTQIQLSEPSQIFENKETNVYNNRQMTENSRVVSFIKKIDEQVTNNYKNLKEVFRNVRGSDGEDITDYDLNQFTIDSFQQFCTPILEMTRERSELAAVINNVIQNVLCSYFTSCGQMIQERDKSVAIKYFLDKIEQRVSGIFIKDEEQGEEFRRKGETLRKRDVGLYQKFQNIFRKIGNQNEQKLLRNEQKLKNLQQNQQKIIALQREIVQLRYQILIIRNQNQNSLKTVRELLQKQQENIQKCQTLQIQLNFLVKQKSEIQRKFKSLKKSQQSKLKSFVEGTSFFAGEILQNKQKQKEYLIELINFQTSQNIDRTNMIYDLKSDQKDFHNKIDGHSNLVIFLQTEKTLLSFYYQGEYSQKGIMNDFGMIVSSKKPFTCYLCKKDNNKSQKFVCFLYHPQDLIIGNGDLVINIEKKKVKIVAASKLFQFQGKVANAYDLFNQQNAEQVILKDLKIYEIEFQMDNQCTKQ